MFRLYARASANFAHRACVGRNLASLELQIIVASIMRRYHFVLEKPEQEVRFFPCLAFPFLFALWTRADDTVIYSSRRARASCASRSGAMLGSSGAMPEGWGLCYRASRGFCDFDCITFRWRIR